MIKEILESNLKTFLTFAILFFALACPGLLTIAVFLPDLYRSLEFTKLLGLAVAGCAPFVLVNAFVLTDMVKEIFRDMDLTYEMKQQLIQGQAASAALIALFPLYVPTLVWICWQSCPLRYAICAAVAIQWLAVRAVKRVGRAEIPKRLAAEAAKKT